MADIRPAASLTSSLLARRGDARPAMRRQPISHLHLPTEPHDDLGWNDIGDDLEPSHPPVTSLAAMTPLGGHPDREEDDDDAFESHDFDAPEPAPAPIPIVAAEPPAPAPLSPLTRHLEEISERITSAPRDVSSFKPMLERTRAPAKAPKAEAAVDRKAAFTLRIDAERHLRLRLLSALVNRSSQQLLIEALDALLASHEQVDDLAGQVRKSAGKRGQ